MLFEYVAQTYFHFLWTLLLADQWRVKGGGVAWHLLKGELKSPQADGRTCFTQDGGLDLGTMGNWGERGSLTTPFYGWKVGLREGKSIHLSAQRTSNRWKGSHPRLSVQGLSQFFRVKCLPAGPALPGPLHLECLSPGAVM